MLPDQMFYNTGIFTYVWLLRNEKPASHRERVMIIDARKQFEKEPKAFSNKRNRMTDAHRQWIEERYRDGWKPNYSDEHVKIFQNNGKQKDFAYHKVSVVFWQTDENDQPAIITEQYDKSFTATNIAKEQAFYSAKPLFGARRQAQRDAALEPKRSSGVAAIQTIAVVGSLQNGSLHFNVELTDPRTGRSAKVEFTLEADDSFSKVYEKIVREAFPVEIAALTKELTDATAKKKAVKRFIDSLRAEVELTHRHYVKDDEYIPYGENIEEFLKREIAKPIIRWEDSPQLGYEFLPNKYFYRYQSPTPAKDLLYQFWKLEKKAEGLLGGLATNANQDA
jgi:type I restriction enzyme M protein